MTEIVALVAASAVGAAWSYVYAAGPARRRCWTSRHSWGRWRTRSIDYYGDPTAVDGFFGAEIVESRQCRRCGRWEDRRRRVKPER